MPFIKNFTRKVHTFGSDCRNFTGAHRANQPPAGIAEGS
jgi:hypothetical protein